MNCKVLIFRTDRIGDLLFTCPAIITLKKKLNNAEITLVTSEKNYDYALRLNIFKRILKFPKKNLLKKIKFIYGLSNINFDYIFIFDGKERSIISAILNKSLYKIALTSRLKFYYRFLKIDFFVDTGEIDLTTMYKKMLNKAKIDSSIDNFDFLKFKKDNNFSLNIPIKNYLHIHLDEKWFSEIYIKTYTNINPSYDDFIKFLNILSDKYDVLITTGLNDFKLIKDLKENFFNKISNNIFSRKNFSKSIFLVYKPSFDDIESLLRNTYILISCHGAITHASNSFNVKKIDILEEKKIKFYARFTTYLNNYYPTYRASFNELSNKISEKILNLSN